MVSLVALHIPISGLVRHGTDRSRPVHIVFPKEDFSVVMGLGLVFPGEVQIDIGDFIPMET